MKNEKGVVVSAKMEKTVVVRREKLIQHPKYKKYLMRRTRVKVRDTVGVKEGDVVEIAPTRPLSGEVRWRVLRILGRRLTPDAPVEIPGPVIRPPASQAAAPAQTEGKKA